MKNFWTVLPKPILALAPTLVDFIGDEEGRTNCNGTQKHDSYNVLMKITNYIEYTREIQDARYGYASHVGQNRNAQQRSLPSNRLQENLEGIS